MILKKNDKKLSVSVTPHRVARDSEAQFFYHSWLRLNGIFDLDVDVSCEKCHVLNFVSHDLIIMSQHFTEIFRLASTSCGRQTEPLGHYLFEEATVQQFSCKSNHGMYIYMANKREL